MLSLWFYEENYFQYEQLINANNTTTSSKFLRNESFIASAENDEYDKNVLLLETNDVFTPRKGWKVIETKFEVLLILDLASIPLQNHQCS